jgi:hypothetical protein
MKINQFVRHLIWITSFLIVGHGPLQAQDCGISVAVASAKASYALDDLIAVNVTFSTQASPESLRFIYTALQDPSGVFLNIQPTRDLVRSPDLPALSGGIDTRIQIPAWRTLTTQVYLQRFLDGFHLGHYDIPWDIKVPCEGKGKPLTAKGILGIDIELERNAAGKNAILQSEFAEFLVAARALPLMGTNSFQETPFRRQEAMEALGLTRSPLVISYLEQLTNDDSYLQEQAFKGLAKFSGNEEAKRVIYQSLQSQNPSVVTRGLGVLNTWQVHLAETDVKSLLLRDNRALQIEVLRYVGSSKDSKYQAILEEFAGHPDPAVAAQARAAIPQIKH